MPSSKRSAGPPTRLPGAVKLLGWLSFLNDVASEMVFPLLPQFLVSTMGASRFLLGAIEGAADAVASLLKLASGGWSDRNGRRKPWLVAGYSVAALLRPCIALVTAPWHLLVIRLGDRLGKGIRSSPRDALIAESAADGQRGRAFGFQRGMDHLGAAVGPLLAALYLWYWPNQYRTLFAWTLVPGLAVVALVVLGLREKKGKPREKVEPFHLTLAPFDASFRRYLLALAIFTLGNSNDAFLLLRAAELGVPDYQIPLLWFAFHIAKSVGNMIAGGWVDHFGARPLIFAGWLVYGIVYLMFGLAQQTWHVWGLFLIYAVYFALAEPAEKTLVTVLSGGKRKGLAFGWFNFTMGIVILPSNLLFGLLYDRFGAWPAFSLGAGLAVAAAMILATVRSVDQTSQQC